MNSFMTLLSSIKEILWSMNIIEKCFVALITIVVSKLFIRFSKIAVRKMFSLNTKISPRKNKTVSAITESVIKYMVYFFTFCQILTLMGFDITSIIAVAGVGSVAIGFGAQSLVQDLISGVFILMEDQFGVGDIVDIDGLSGTVENISIRSTRMRNVDGNVHIIPNGQIKIVTNMSKGFNRAVVDVGIAYEEDIDKVIDIMNDELKKIYDEGEISGLLNIPQVLGVVDLMNGAVTIRISADSQIGENWAIEREIRRFIKKRLDKEGIYIPYPQRVVHISK